ncbi:MAG TPA: hypothetical protein VEP90_24705 [Methylomirabilota bacterium]|nr:hypothetical protein [Methylomirabilota bacterium]
MKTALVIPSIQRLNNLVAFKPELKKYGVRVIVVDEGDNREENSKILDGLDFSFFGPGERVDILGNDIGVIPQRCHAETSFGFFQAYREGAEIVVELDDDCWGTDLLSKHVANLGPTRGMYVEQTKSGWYNPLWSMSNDRLYPRGYPYASETRVFGGVSYPCKQPTVLNMGLWTGQPDLDATTILRLGGLRGLAGQNSESQLIDQKKIIGKNIFFPICSMNTSFRAEIIPAFYQMYMNYEGLDRYCDIWSGLFIKKICDHLGKNISLGQPVVEHRKTERSTFKDLRAEHEGMAINETLWKVVRDAEIEGKNYRDAYDSLTDEIIDAMRFHVFPDKLHYKMMLKQIWGMRRWLELFE